MGILKSKHSSWVPSLPDDLRHPFAKKPKRRGSNSNLVIAGAVVVGLGFLTWHYLGPDVKRYLKIYNM
jgi:hypothetical protein